jgi:hypothetical protein
MDDSPQARMRLVIVPPNEPDPGQPEARPRVIEPAKITARMRQIRELIDQGSYPDLDELAERIVQASTRTT